MMFRQQKQDNCENENEDCKTAMILTKNKTDNDKIITAAARALQQPIWKFNLETKRWFLLHYFA